MLMAGVVMVGTHPGTAVEVPMMIVVVKVVVGEALVDQLGADLHPDSRDHHQDPQNESSITNLPILDIDRCWPPWQRNSERWMARAALLLVLPSLLVHWTAAGTSPRSHFPPAAVIVVVADGWVVPLVASMMTDSGWLVVGASGIHWLLAHPNLIARQAYIAHPLLGQGWPSPWVLPALADCW